MAKRTARIDRRIEVILLEQNKHLGEKYDIVKVKPIFARNVLFPQGIAILADDDALYAYQKKIANGKVVKTQKSDTYNELFKKLSNDNGLHFVMKANEKWALYEKIDPAHIVSKIKELHNIDIEEHYFKMKKKIAIIWEYTIPFQYNNLEKDLIITVKSDNSSVKEKNTITDENTEEVSK